MDDIYEASQHVLDVNLTYNVKLTFPNFTNREEASLFVEAIKKESTCSLSSLINCHPEDGSLFVFIDVESESNDSIIETMYIIDSIYEEMIE